MATRLSNYSEEERAVLHDCRRKSVLSDLKWGLPSLLPLWMSFRAGLLPRFAAVPIYTASFVLFSFLGAMSNNHTCIENILALEDSELAAKLRKSLPRQAREYDLKKTRESSIRSRETSSSGTEGVAVTDNSTTREVRSQWVDKGWGMEGRRGSGGRGEVRDGGEWMERQDNRRAVRRNKYGDIVFDDDVK